MRVLSRLFRRLFLDRLAALHTASRLAFFGDLSPRQQPSRLRRYTRAAAPIRMGRLRQAPLRGPEAVLAYLARYTHRVAISNAAWSRWTTSGVTFKWKDYRTEGPDRYKIMTLAAPEFIRRFLLHVLPSGFHRIRHYGLFASAARARNIERARALLAVAETPQQQQPETDGDADPVDGAHKCPCCGGRMLIIETFEGVRPARPASPCRIRLDSS